MVATLGLLTISSSAISAVSVKNRPWYKHIENSRLEYSLPKIQKFKLKNGIPVYYLPERSIPLTEIRIYLDGGGLEVAADKAGLQGIWGETVVYSGSKAYDREKLSEYLEDRASKINYTPAMNRSAFSLKSLSHYFSADLKVLYDVMLNPAFAKEDFEFIRKQVLNEISKREENPGRLAALASQLFGYKGTIRAQLPYTRTVSSISAGDLQTWQLKMMRAERMTIAVSGDFDKDTLEKELNSLFGALPYDAARKPDLSSLAQLPQMPAGKILHYHKDVPQSTIMLRAPGMPHNAKDYFAWRLYDFILGGDSFNSELTQIIRTRNGWAYSVYSTYDSDEHQGSVTLFTQTANKNVNDVLAEMRKILSAPENFTTPERLELAKISLQNKFVFMFESPGQYLALYLSVLWDGLPEDYLKDIPANIRKVTREEVMRVAKTYYQPDNFFAVLVGPDKVYTQTPATGFNKGVEKITIEK